MQPHIHTKIIELFAKQESLLYMNRAKAPYYLHSVLHSGVTLSTKFPFPATKCEWSNIC